MTHFLNFETPIISLEHLKLGISNLVRRLIVAINIVCMIDYTEIGVCWVMYLVNISWTVQCTRWQHG